MRVFVVIVVFERKVLSARIYNDGDEAVKVSGCSLCG